MIPIDPLVILLLGEAVLVLGGIAISLFLKIRRIRQGNAAEQQEMREPASPPVAAPSEPDHSREEQDRMNEIIIKQAAKIADLFGYKDLFIETRKKLDSLQTAQQEIGKRLAAATESEQELSVVRDMKDSVERVNKELEMCVAVLEKENQRLTDDYVAWQKELSQPGEGGADGLDQVRDLRRALDEKNAELEAVKTKLASLEKEYMVLYEKHVANGSSEKDGASA